MSPIDDAVADHHLQRVDGGVLRQREDVDALDPAVGRVLEVLGDAGAGDRPGDGDVDVGADPRRLDEGAGLGASRRSEPVPISPGLTRASPPAASVRDASAKIAAIARRIASVR